MVGEDLSIVIINTADIPSRGIMREPIERAVSFPPCSLARGALATLTLTRSRYTPSTALSILNDDSARASEPGQASYLIRYIMQIAVW